MNEMNKTENEAVKRMNETANSQTEESESTNECPINLIREESQEREKSPNCLTKRDLQKIHAQKNWGMRILDVIVKLSFTIYEFKDSFSKSSRTSRLWINYMNYINIVETFIRPDMTGN